MTHEKQLERLRELGWRCEKTSSYDGTNIWGWLGPDGRTACSSGPWSEPAPIPDELLALLEADEPTGPIFGISDEYVCSDCGEQNTGDCVCSVPKPKQAHTPELRWVASTPEYGRDVHIRSDDKHQRFSFVSEYDIRHIEGDAVDYYAHAKHLVDSANACAPYPDPAAHMAEQERRIAELEAVVIELGDVEDHANKHIAEQDAKIERLEKVCSGLIKYDDIHDDFNATNLGYVIDAACAAIESAKK